MLSKFKIYKSIIENPTFRLKNPLLISDLAEHMDRLAQPPAPYVGLGRHYRVYQCLFGDRPARYPETPRLVENGHFL